MKKMQKGFSLVELMVVIAIIAILAAVAIPMYSNYTTRAKISAEIGELGGVKADVSEKIANTDTTSGTIAITAVLADTADSGLPEGTGIAADGTITKTSKAISGSAIKLTPSIGTGTVTWACTVDGNPSPSAIPSTCGATA